MNGAGSVTASLVELPLEDIKYDQKYCFSYPLKDESLTESVRQVGVVTPIWVTCATDGAPLLISGFRRAKAAKLAGLDKVAAIEYAGINPYELFIKHLYENRANREFNLVEQANIVSSAMDNFSKTEKEVIDTLMPITGLSKSAKILSRLKKTSAFGEAAKQLIYETGMKTGAAIILDSYTDAEREALCRWLMQYKFGLNRSIKLMEAIAEICSIENGSVESVLNKAQVVATGAFGNNKQSSALLYSLIMKRKKPQLERMETEMNNAVAALGLPANVEVKAPENFEGRDIELKIKADNAQALLDSARAIASVKKAELEKLYKWL